ncbi:MAG: hypothetical protein JWR35_3706, partial [Marmoricola sp.]|nr:hypothetical protein [Marmoricola sp.]
MTVRRRRAVGIIVGVAVLASVLGVCAGLWVKSPADVAANAAAPPPSVITAAVEKRVVSDELVTRGTVGALATVNGLPSATPAGVAKAVITKLPAHVGDALKPGAVVVEVSGQPVFYLPGKLPAYRDLKPGDRGPDVVQL